MMILFLGGKIDHLLSFNRFRNPLLSRMERKQKMKKKIDKTKQTPLRLQWLGQPAKLESAELMKKRKLD